MLDTLRDAIGTLAARLSQLEAEPFNPYSPDADIFDHFSGDGTLDSRWTATLVLTGTVTLPNATPSYARLASGATANSTARLDFGARFPLVGLTKSVDMRWRARFPTAVDAVADLRGFLVNTGPTQTAGLGVRGATSTGFMVAETFNVSSTFTITTVAIDTAWHDFRMQTMPDRIRFFIDNVQVAEHLTTLPTATGLTPWLRALNGATVADRQMDVDLIWVRENR